jgi:hypothetical protein
MLGSDEQPGIIHRSVQKLFFAKEAIERRSGIDCRVKISVEMLEIYNETVRRCICVCVFTSSPAIKANFYSVYRFVTF